MSVEDIEQQGTQNTVEKPQQSDTSKEAREQTLAEAQEYFLSQMGSGVEDFKQQDKKIETMPAETSLDSQTAEQIKQEIQVDEKLGQINAGAEQILEQTKREIQTTEQSEQSKVTVQSKQEPPAQPEQVIAPEEQVIEQTDEKKPDSETAKEVIIGKELPELRSQFQSAVEEEKTNHEIWLQKDNQLREIDLQIDKLSKQQKELRDWDPKLGQIKAQLERLTEQKNTLKTERNDIAQKLDSLRDVQEKAAESFREYHGIDKQMWRDFIHSDDAMRDLMNRYFGVNLPIFAKELRSAKVGADGLPDIFEKPSREELKNIVEQQVTFYNEFKDRYEALKGLPNETKKQIMKEVALEAQALSTNHDLSYAQNEAIGSAFFHAITTKEGTVSIDFSEELYPKGLHDLRGKEISPYVFRQYLHDHSSLITNNLLLYKAAKERGLIK